MLKPSSICCMSFCVSFCSLFFSPFSIAITSLGEERANLSAFSTFVRFVLPLGVWEGLRFVIVALPGLFSYLFFFPICEFNPEFYELIELPLYIKQKAKMIPKESAYSDQAHNAHWSVFKVKTVDIINQNIVVTSDGKSFQVSFPNVSEKYIFPYVKSECCCPKMANRLDVILAKSV